MDEMEYYGCDDVEDDMLEAMNNSGELIIDVNDLLASPTYVAGAKDISGQAKEEVRTTQSNAFHSKYIVRLPFKVAMQRDDRLMSAPQGLSIVPGGAQVPLRVQERLEGERKRREEKRGDGR